MLISAQWREGERHVWVSTCEEAGTWLPPATSLGGSQPVQQPNSSSMAWALLKARRAADRPGLGRR